MLWLHEMTILVDGMLIKGWHVNKEVLGLASISASCLWENELLELMGPGSIYIVILFLADLKAKAIYYHL